MHSLEQKVIDIMRDRGYMHWSTGQNSSNDLKKKLSFALSDLSIQPRYACDVFLAEEEKEVTFSFFYTIPKSMYYVTGGKMGSFFDEEHFRKLERKFIEVCVPFIWRED